MQRIISDTKKPVKIWASDLESEAEQQVRNLAGLPFIYRHVAVMPDAHAGKGSTVGTVIATIGAIIPSAVGVDIGCGMCAVKLPFTVDRLPNLKTLRSAIEAAVPVGFEINKEVSHHASELMHALGCPHAPGYQTPAALNKAAHQLGSLGGGNHFIEICRDEHDGAWIMLHSGSRNIGKVLADIHISSAKGLMKKYFIDLPDPDLAYLAQGTDEFGAYIKDLRWAQRYARYNREVMMQRVLHIFRRAMNLGIDELQTLRVDCHHNYTSMENHFGQNVWVTRKGAVSAKAGELGIIPGSMGTKSYIVQGNGNTESFCSCSHGAGRRMSRSKARKMFTADDLATQTAGIECRKDDGVVDEIPASYKDIDEVMANQSDLVTPLFTLNQLICIKG